MSGGWFDDEAIEQERHDADLLQAQYEAEGSRYALRVHQMTLLRAEGNFRAAAAKCPHDGGYPLDSPAAGHNDDPNAGEDGIRCTTCGSRLSDWSWDGGVVLVPCELDRDPCPGHPADEFSPMGETVYCDGSCQS